jgi:hypothetical protein
MSLSNRGFDMERGFIYESSSGRSVARIRDGIVTDARRGSAGQQIGHVFEGNVFVDLSGEVIGYLRRLR